MSKSGKSEQLLIGALFTERGVLATLVVAQILAILLSFAPQTQGNAWIRLAGVSVFFHLVFLSSSSCLYFLQSYLADSSAKIQLSVLVLLVSLFTLFYSLGYLALPELFLISLEPHWFIVRNLLFTWLIAILFVQFLLIHHEKERQTNALARAELDALQARIRPHFLFNSLNTAAELTHSDSDAAEQVILALSALSKAAMQSGQAISLIDELQLCKQYLMLESWRYGNRLKLDWHLPAQLPTIQLPCLTLQPLLENAVCHGVEPSTEPVTIKIQMLESAKSVTWLITNPLCQSQSSRPSNGMAIANIHQRLILFYGAKATLSSAKRDGEYRVKLVLPK